MRAGIVVEVTAADRARLEAVVADGNNLQKYVWRARIVLLTADGCGTGEIMRRTGKAKTAVWRWQEPSSPQLDAAIRHWASPLPPPAGKPGFHLNVDRPAVVAEVLPDLLADGAAHLLGQRDVCLPG
jgi:hypothetical protein